MKERPILFSAPMVRATLEGRKTQTRRIAKSVVSVHAITGEPLAAPDSSGQRVCCPYGQPGDRLWVREAFDFLPNGSADEPRACEIVYWATGSAEARIAPADYNPMIYGREKVRPSIHMPRWASRILLDVTGVRVERLQDISDEDAIAEGIDRDGMFPWRPDEILSTSPDISRYALLWESINGARSWDANPWVWVIEFKRVVP